MTPVGGDAAGGPLREENRKSRGRRNLSEQGSYGRIVRKSVIWGYVRTGLQLLVTIPTTVALARLLTPEEFGIAAAAGFFGSLATRLSSGGLGQAIVRTKDLRSEHISTIFTINVAVTSVMVLALVAAAPAIGRFYGRPEVGWLMPLIGVVLAVGALSGIQHALLNRDLRYRETATIATVDMTVSAASAVAFAALGFSYWSLALSSLCGALVKFGYGARVAGWHLTLKFVPSAARELGSFAAGAYVRRLLEHLSRNVDNLVIGRVLGMSALGFYDKAFTLNNKLFSKLTVVGPSVAFRVFSIIDEEAERFRRAYHKVVMTTTLMTYPAFAALGTMAPHLIVFALGERWRPSIVPCQVLCLSFALKAMDQYAITASTARGWMWPHVWRQLVAVLCIVVGVYVGATHWGIVGAAAAVVTARFITSLLTQGITRAATGLRWADTLMPQVPAIAIATLIGTSLWAIDVALAPRAASPVVLLVQTAAAALITLGFAVWCPFNDARVLMHDAVSDHFPRLAARLWHDVAARQQEDKRARRQDRQAKKASSEAQAPITP